jgi:inner membrane protein
VTNRTHDAIAFASLTSVAILFPPASLNLLTFIFSIIAADIGSMIPDMDQAGNKLWDFLPAGNFMGRIFKGVFYKHRTLSHSILGTFLIFKFLQFVLEKLLNPGFINPQIILTALMIGYISHLVADAFTREGLPLLFPLKLTFGIPPIKKLRIRTGKFFENFIVFPLTWIFTITVIYLNQDRLIEILNIIR